MKTLLLIAFAGLFSQTTYCKDNQSPQEITGKRFLIKLQQDITGFSEEKLAHIKRQLLSSNDIDPALFALEFIKSKNKKVQDFGFEIMTGICIARPISFKSNEFYKAYAKKGMSSSPYLSEIIEKTDDDFCREWACELTVDIYYNNTKVDNSRHIKIKEVKKEEVEIYDSLKQLLANEEEVKKIVDANKSPRNIILKKWGMEKRIPLKMLAVVSTLDLMNPENISPCSERIRNIINTYNFNYNILGRLNGKPIDRPPLPEAARLKKLSDAVLKADHQDTFQWISKDEGGFTVDELEIAVKMKERKKMKQMLSVLKKIITNMLKGKILIGLGNNELSLLHYFNQATWGRKKFDWDNKMLTISNKSKSDATLLISSTKESGKPVEFHIPGRSDFTWFLPNGEYSIKSTKSSQISYINKKLQLRDNNICLDIAE